MLTPLLAAGRGAHAADSAADGGGLAEIEEKFNAATMLQHGLYGMMTQAAEGDCDLDRDDFYPFWELTLKLEAPAPRPRG